MNTTPICEHCGRPIRNDARTYTTSGGCLFHWECTEPAPPLHVARIALHPGDSVAVQVDKAISYDQRKHLGAYVARTLGVDAARVLVLDGGIGLSVLIRRPTKSTPAVLSSQDQAGLGSVQVLCYWSTGQCEELELDHWPTRDELPPDAVRFDIAWPDLGASLK